MPADAIVKSAGVVIVDKENETNYDCIVRSKIRRHVELFIGQVNLHSEAVIKKC